MRGYSFELKFALFLIICYNSLHMAILVIVRIFERKENIMLIVRYLGHPVGATVSCDPPIDLFKGHLYEVARIKVYGGLHLYELRGIPGKYFSARWFSRIGESYDQPETEVWNALILGGDYQRLF